MTTTRAVFVLLTCLALTACSPMLIKNASDAEDAKAKTFASDPSAALIYVYRDDSFRGSDLTSNIILNDKAVAEGASSRYNILSVQPGYYALKTYTNDVGALPALLHNRDKPSAELTVEAGKVYFVHEKWIGIKGFFLVTATQAEAEPAIKKGKLIMIHQIHDEPPMQTAKVNGFAAQYTAAWCSQNAASVAAFFAPSGSLKINDGDPAVGRTAIAAAAQSFMTAFPDLVVHMDRLAAKGGTFEYHWTLTGTNTGPSGTGKPVRISGYEEWRLDGDGLIAESKGHFDAADYQRQLNNTASK